MTSPAKTSLIGLILLGLLILSSSLYVVYEGQEGILLRLGEIVTDRENKPVIKTPGLHFKWPMINNARIFDVRLQTLDIESSRIVTEEKKDVLVDSYVKWRIHDLPLYYTRTSGNELQAQTLLKQKVNDGLRAEFGRRNIKEVVSGERSDIMSLLLTSTNQSAKNLGIEVLDVRIKRIDLPVEVSSNVFERMRSERARVATKHRSDGKSAAEAIRASADATVTVKLAEADRTSKQIRGEGDAKSASIYAKAYQQSEEFFEFYRSLNAYKNAFDGQNDFLVLQPDSQFFRYFNQSKANP